jgi:Cu/Zn superoxide dismutase
MKILRFALLGTALAGMLAAAAAADAPMSLTVKMTAQNGSGESGTAVLTQTADGVKVVITLTGAPKDTPQPTHIHPGTCAKLNPAPKYPLTNTVNGSSTTTVKGVKLSDLLAGTFAINVHKSSTEIATYVSCGDITQSP